MHTPRLWKAHPSINSQVCRVALVRVNWRRISQSAGFFVQDFQPKLGVGPTFRVGRSCSKRHAVETKSTREQALICIILFHSSGLVLEAFLPRHALAIVRQKHKVGKLVSVSGSGSEGAVGRCVIALETSQPLPILQVPWTASTAPGSVAQDRKAC